MHAHLPHLHNFKPNLTSSIASCLLQRLEAHIGKEKRSRDEVKKLLSAQDDEAAEGNRTLETVGQKLRDVKSNNEGTGIGMAKEEDLKASIKTGMNRCREDAIGQLIRTFAV